jgi:hypothetical protein
MAGWRLDDYKTWEELLFRASFERSPNDLLMIRKFGRSASLTANTTEDVWESGGTKALPYTAGELISVVSASANDDLNGTGAWYVQIGGLDTSYNLQNETVTLDGLTPVQTTNQFIAINRVRSVFHGSGQKNAGAITITGATSSNVYATIPAGECITQQSHFTIPAGYTLFTSNVAMTAYRASGGSGTKSAEIDQMVYVPDVNAIYQTLRYGVTSNGGPYVSNNGLLSQTPGKSTLWFQATPETNGTVVTTTAGYVLVKGDFNYITEI